MVRFLVAVLVLGLVLPGCASAQTEEPSPFVIVPGTSIGPISLGMPFEAVLKVLGPYQESNVAIPGFPRYIWTKLPKDRLHGRFVVASGTGSVDAVSVLYDSRYATSTGVHIGDSSTSVRLNIGRPAAVTPGFYDAAVWLYPGLALTIGNSNSSQWEDHVSGIGVGRGYTEIF
jgi:hypothetical protein